MWRAFDNHEIDACDMLGVMVGPHVYHKQLLLVHQLADEGKGSSCWSSDSMAAW